MFRRSDPANSSFSDFAISDLDSIPGSPGEWSEEAEAARREKHWADLNRAAITSRPSLSAWPATLNSAERSCAAQIRLESTRKSVLATLLSVGAVVGGSCPVPQHTGGSGSRRIHHLVGKALRGVDESSYIVVEDDGGASVCFLDDPEEALRSALVLRGLCLQKYGQKLSLRMGLHLGALRTVNGINLGTKILGDGVNVAQRVMDFAQADQIVASRAYVALLSPISDMRSDIFKPLGIHLDRDLRSHDIYAVLDPTALTNDGSSSNDGFPDTAAFPAALSSRAELLCRIESELAQLIGPLAQVLVKKAATHATGNQALRELLAAAVADPAARLAFLNG